MKSTAVYTIIRRTIGPWTKIAGFKRGSGAMLSYVRPAGRSFQTFWFQCSQDGWESHTGSKFTLEFQESNRPDPGQVGRRERFFRLLTVDEREQVRFLQNAVISKLQPPPTGHWAYNLGGEATEWYFRKFAPICDPYGEGDDIWMRYGDEADVCRWADFLLPVLPQLFERFIGRDETAGG